MSATFVLGTATAKPGTIQYGRWEAFEHPTGHAEFLPVIVAQGKEDGPCLWLTAGLHGPEQAGPLVLFRLLTRELVGKLKGTVVAMPALSPVGQRTAKREPYHAPKDPNRIWPDGRPEMPPDPDKTPPSSLELAYRRLFREIEASADALIDFHNSATNSLSFSFRDRVLYRTDTDEPKEEARARVLAGRLEHMMRAYGHTIVNEYPSRVYVDEKLHRSTSGAAVMLAGIPAFTAELSTGHMPDPAIIGAAVAGTRNVMRHAGLLDGRPEPIEGVRVVDPGFPVRRRRTPRVTEPCVVEHLVQPGEAVGRDDPVARTLDIWGRPLGEGVLRAECDGFVLSRAHGIYYYPGDAVLTMAIRDEEPLFAPYPADYYKDEQSRATGEAPQGPS